MLGRQLFITREEFDLKKIQPVVNRHNRPSGGLWTSKYREDVGSEWLRSQLCLLTPDSVGFIFDCEPGAKILQVANIEDALDVLDRYCVQVLIPPPLRPNGEEIGLGHYEIDFEAMAKHYDAIHVTGQAVKIHNDHNGRFSPFADWLVDSTVWFNAKRLKLIGTLEYPKLSELKVKQH